MSSPCAKALTLHGVFLRVFEQGVLLTGASGIGKSELALELVSRGHALIADDTPEFTAEADQVIGRCPELLQGFIEVRGLGILHLGRLMGENAIAKQQRLDLLIELISPAAAKVDNRLSAKQEDREILGRPFPVWQLSMASGRNLAVMVEMAARSHALAQSGYDAASDLQNRLRQQLSTDTP
ncbi:hypothetical protein [Ectothiorhodosinus mongolicus]|uniref:hypothetical protein n=1 Tax=Ectothiorhodosinus mongolicus TaxID=233100 RepID=UPI0009772DAA|nr:hypothetical protein [Ectothiorhodosinus mongolicus]ULX56717.1 hypothetical protein CKX93_02735 [Ectothiorhodosinus mongolicus]